MFKCLLEGVVKDSIQLEAGAAQKGWDLFPLLHPARDLPAHSPGLPTAEEGPVG